MSTQPSQSSSLPTIGDAQPSWSRLLVAVIFFGWLTIIWFWPVSIYTLTADDSYYYLKTAANAGQGYGFTFDRINPTDGFHPLWMLMLIPLSWLSGGSQLNMELFARLALTLQLAMVFAGAVLLSRALDDRKRWVVLATSILMLNFYYTKILVNALESGVQWFFLCATLAWAVELLKREIERTTPVQFLMLGILAGLTVLSRLTAVVFAGAILLLVLIVSWRSASFDPQRTNGEKYVGLIIRRLVMASMGIALIVLPYLAWNYYSFGHLATVSAVIKTSRPFTRTNEHWIAGAGLAIVWLLACATLWKSNLYEPFARNLIWATFALFTYAVSQEEGDIILRGSLKSELWYMVPQAVLAALALAYLCHRSHARKPMWYLLTTAVVLGFLVLDGYTWYYRLDPSSYAGYLAARRSADWLRNNTPSDATAAGWDVGIVGGFSDRSVLNLDGLINSWDYFENYFDKDNQEKWAQKRTEKWITSVHPAEYIVQYFWEDQATPDQLQNYRGVDLLKWNVVYAEPVIARAWSNQREARKSFYFVLSRTGNGVPLGEYLQKMNPSGGAVPADH
jgi:hypothetical protein